ncbi:MAG: gamma-glutamyl-gamma-aminobutyrate hydrolase family protein [Candidatus Riflebacteria bacterium]|nr:gamma-glutamyl-gamma-aminobutyrate hydrolase family protein [Candidatus Riflebacteria bacterium]
MKPVISLTVNFIGPGEKRCPSQTGAYYINSPYVDQVRRAGGVPLYLPYSDDPDDLAALLDRTDGLLLSGGKDMDPTWFDEEPHPACERILPDRTAADVGLTRLAVKRRMPILGICLGLQTLTVALGGSLFQDIPSQCPSEVKHRQAESERMQFAHPVTIVEGSLLDRVVGRTDLEVNSMHHQAANRIGRDLVVTARAPDGVVEALEHPGLPFCLAVQWHPEDLQEHPPHRALFDAFVAAARRYREER